METFRVGGDRMKNFIIKIKLFVVMTLLISFSNTVFSQVPTFNGKPITVPTDELTIEYILSILNRATKNQSPEQLQTLKDNEFKQLWIHIPSTTVVGHKVKLDVQAWDSYERLAASFEGRIAISSTDKMAKLPKEYLFTTDFPIEQGIIPGYLVGVSDNGKHAFENVIFNTPGIHYIYVRNLDKNEQFISNPIKVSNKSEINIYWGDIHGHSNFSDGAGFPKEYYSYAKNVAMLDFACLTDHDSYISPWGNDPQPYLMKHFFWPRIKKISDKWNKSGDFVTLIGYEWSSLAQGPGGPGFGHYNVYYNTDDEAPFYSHTDNEIFNIEDLWAKLKEWKQKKSGRDVITIPHHITRGATPIDWAYYNPEFVPLIEIYSEWGSSEMLTSKGNTKPLKHGTAEIKETGFSVQDGLAMGRKVSFMGSGDSHDGRPGHSLMHTAAHNIYQYPYGTIIWHVNQTMAYQTHYPNGLAAVFSKELERKNIFNALKNRACYATSHVDRMLIDFQINGKHFYKEQNLTLNKDEPKLIKVMVAGDGNMSNSRVEKIELIKNNKVIYTHLGNNLVESFEYVDYEPVKGTEYEGGYFENGKFKINSLSKKYLDKRPSTSGEDFYYIRVTEENGEMGWAGPIWVKSEM
jgi:hypothetical protein